MCLGLLRRYCGFYAMLFVIASLPAEGSLITFTDRTSFEAATTGLTTTGFEGVVPANSKQDFPNPAGLIVDGITFQTSGTGPLGPGLVSVYGADYAAEQGPVFDTGTGTILVWAPPGQPGTALLDILLPHNKTAFAADIWAQQPFVTSVRAIVNSGEATANFDFNTVDRPAPYFFGVVSDTNTILLVRLAIPPGQVGLILDNVSVGTAGGNTNPVPEPSTMLLLSAGLVSVMFFNRKHLGL